MVLYNLHKIKGKRNAGTIIFISFFFSLSCFHSFQLPLECYNYSYLNDSVRAQGFYNGYNGYYQCDNNLQFGWYRFSGSAGSQMATNCVGKNRCSSHSPGWLSTPHPSRDDGIVNGTVCFHWDSGCCVSSTNIRVRNCSGFYVYELGPPPGCHLRYCGNGGGMLHLLQQTGKVWSVWQAETKGPFPSLPNPLSLFPPFPSPFLRLSRRLEKYNNHFFSNREPLLNCFDSLWFNFKSWQDFAYPRYLIFPFFHMKTWAKFRVTNP